MSISSLKAVLISEDSDRRVKLDAIKTTIQSCLSSTKSISDDKNSKTVATNSNSKSTIVKLLDLIFNSYLSSPDILNRQKGSFPMEEFDNVLTSLFNGICTNLSDVEKLNYTTNSLYEYVVTQLLDNYLLCHLDLLNYFLIWHGNTLRRYQNEKSNSLNANKDRKLINGKPITNSTSSNMNPKIIVDWSLYSDLIEKTGSYLKSNGLLIGSICDSANEDLPLFFSNLEKTEFKLKSAYHKAWQEFLKGFDPRLESESDGNASSDIIAKTDESSGKDSANTNANKSSNKLRAQLLRVQIAKRQDNLKKKLLLHLTSVFEYFDNPLILSNFFLEQFDKGSLEIQICALSGLLYFSTQKNLDFGDDYYQRVYTLLRPEALQMEYKVRFQRILAASLIQAAPLGLHAACFCKKLLVVAARIQMSTPDSLEAICWCIGLSYNIAKKNEGTCKEMLHREPKFRNIVGAKESARLGEEGPSDSKTSSKSEVEVQDNHTSESDSIYHMRTDPFRLDLSLEQACSTISRTSLWELEALGRHWYPLVSRLCLHFKNPDMFLKTAPPCDVNQFLKISGTELLKSELKRKRKKFDENPRGFDTTVASLAFDGRPQNIEIEGMYGMLTKELKKRKIVMKKFNANDSSKQFSSSESVSKKSKISEAVEKS